MEQEQGLIIGGDVTPASVSRSRTWFALLGEALRGGTRDFSRGSIQQAIFLLALPMALEMLMESVFAVTDVFFVAKLGADAVATVGLTETLMTIVYTVAIGLSIGASATVARRIGQGDREGASHAAVQIIWLGVTLGAVISFCGFIFAPQLLRLMGASESVIATGTTFTRIMMLGDLATMLLFLINAIFRGAGDAAIAMRVLWLANIINIILGPLFVFGIGFFPQLGVTGAAIGTSIGRTCGVLFAVSYLLRDDKRIRLERRFIRPDAKLMLRLLKLSGSGTVQVFVGMASWIGLMRVVSAFGSDAVAGYTISTRILIFALLPSWGMSNAAATLVGQSLGANDPERAERAVWRTCAYNALFLGFVGLLFIVFTRPIVGIFTADPKVMSYAIESLRIESFGFLFYSAGMVITQSFNGAGDTRTPTLINLFVFWLWEIPLAYVLAFHFGLGASGVFYAIPIAFATLAIVSAALFWRGKWKTVKI